MRLTKSDRAALILVNIPKGFEVIELHETAGLTTHHCISTTTRMAGRKTPDGHNYPAELIHQSALASLSGEFAAIVTSKFIKNMYG